MAVVLVPCLVDTEAVMAAAWALHRVDTVARVAREAMVEGRAAPAAAERAEVA